MVSYSFVTERIATGGGISATYDITLLVEQGITHIIDMRAEFDDDTLNDKRVSVCWIPEQDDGTARNPAQVWQGILFALAALSAKGHKVFIHCAAGVNRGPLQTYAVLRAIGIPKQEAIDTIRTARPEVAFYLNETYMTSVEGALAG